MQPDLIDVIRGLRDDVLEVSRHGDREPPGAEVFEAVLGALAVHGDAAITLDLGFHDAVARRLAWGDGEEAIVADAERVFDRVVEAAERALSDPEQVMIVIEVAAQVTTTVARVVALAALARAGRDRATRLREEMSHRQLRDVLAKQHAAIQRLERDLKRDF